MADAAFVLFQKGRQADVVTNQGDGGNTMRTRITLACTECKQRNYNTTKDKKNHPDRMETSKYCRFCKKHTTHKETK